MAIRIDPTNKTTYRDRANVFKSLGNLDAALSDYTRILELDSSNESAYFQRGLIFLKTRQWQKSIDDFNKVVELNPDNKAAYVNRAIDYKSLGNFEAAVRDCTRIIAINSEDIGAYLFRAELSQQMGDYYQAIRDYNQIIQTNPTNSEAHKNLSEALKTLRTVFLGRMIEVIKGKNTYLAAYDDFNHVVIYDPSLQKNIANSDMKLFLSHNEQTQTFGLNSETFWERFQKSLKRSDEHLYANKIEFLKTVDNYHQLKQNKLVTFMAKRFRLSAFYHMTHIANLESICTHGILSHYEASQRGLIKKDISDPGVQMLRDREDPYYKRSIHSYVPLYINPRNPMLYVRRNLQGSICILEIDLTILDSSEYILTDGNAAAHNTKFFTSLDGFSELPRNVLNTTSWSDKDDGKRKMCAEVLIYPFIPPDYIKRLHFIKYPTDNLIQAIKIPKEINSTLFFKED